MAVTPTPYSQFLTQDSILSTRGGPWRCFGFANHACYERNASWTNNQTSIGSGLLGNETLGDYLMSLQATILVDTASFGDENKFSYSWSFLVTALSSQSLQRSPLLLVSSIGEASYTDYISVQDLANNLTWSNASHFIHTGTAVLPGDGTLKLLNISLSLSLSYLPSEYVVLNFRHLQLILGAATDTSTVSSTTTPGMAATLVSPDTPAVSSTAFIIPPSSTGQPKASTNPWIIACSVVSSLLLISLIILAAFLWKRRKWLRRISVSKVQNVKRPSLLLMDGSPMEVANIAAQDPSRITPYYLGPGTPPINQPQTLVASLIPRVASHSMDRHLRPPPASYLESPSIPVAEQPDAIPIRLTSQQRRLNRGTPIV